MKLAFCLYKYFPFGGMQRDFLAIANACAHAGHEIHVFAYEWQGAQPNNLAIHIIETRAQQNHTKAKEFYTKLQQILSRQKFDLIIGFNKMPGLDVYYAADVCLLSRQKKTFWKMLIPRYRHLFKYEQAVFAPGAQTKIFLLSQIQQQEYAQHYQTEAHRFHLLPPGIAKDRLPPANATEIRHQVRDEFKIAPNDFLLLMIGSSFKTKGVDRAILAFAALPPATRNKCQLFIIGQGNPKKFLQLARRLSIAEKVKFLGARSDAANFLLAADGLLHPSYHENTGTVILEAMISGLPVLTLDICGYAHYVRDYQTGIVLSSPFLQTQLDDALANFVNSSAASEWKKNGLAFGKHADIYSLKEIAREKIIEFATQKNPLDFMHYQGEVFRHQEGRLTQRVIWNNQSYFLKSHHGIGWREIFKNLLQGKLPIISAANENHALLKLKQQGILVPDVIKYHKVGKNPATIQSYILLENIQPHISLEDLVKTWNSFPHQFSLKLKLLAQVAEITRKMHQAGINHRDLYICHFLLKIPDGLAALKFDKLAIYLIDLHRAEIRTKIPPRWLIKDLAALYFSSKDAINNKDVLRFIKHYFAVPLRDSLMQNANLLKTIQQRGEKIYLEHKS